MPDSARGALNFKTDTSEIVQKCCVENVYLKMRTAGSFIFTSHSCLCHVYIILLGSTVH